MTFVNKGELLRAALEAWREVPDDWSFGKLVANAAMIAYGTDVPPRKVEDVKLLEGFRALVPDPFEDTDIIFDPYAKAWEREQGLIP